jgi:CDP-paratose 2-epimerase
MSVAIITGSAGLVGSEATAYFSSLGFTVVGIDNDMRAKFFGSEASTTWQREELKRTVPGYIHHDVDIRNDQEIGKIFQRYGKDISLVIHTAAQPSHDWAATDPFADFTVNANGTSVMVESTRRHSPDAVFIFLSTNKVYGDTPNRLPLVEKATRWEIAEDHPYKQGIPETMSIDHTMHSLFGASKVAADVLVQEYGRYFGMKTACFRGGCLTGPNHSGTQLHGFLAYLMKCTVTGAPYTVFGYKRKQVRDNIHLLPEPAFGRGLQHGRRTLQQLLHGRSHRPLRTDRRHRFELDLQRQQSPGRSHLVDQRSRSFPESLSRLETAIRRPRNSH